MQRITSRQNPIVAEYRAAARGDTDGTLLLDGPHLVAEALDAGLPIRHVMAASDGVDRPEIAALLRRLPAGFDVTLASSQVMDAASPVRSSSLIVALAARPAAPVSVFAGDQTLVVVACDVQDPGNLGAIVRVAEAAGASGVVVAGQSADPFGWKALRGSMGSALRLPILRVADVRVAAQELRRRGTSIVATLPREATPMFEARLTGPLALLIGGEGPGLPDDIVDGADLRVTIPMTASVESLNAAVAAAVLLYEARRQRTAGARLEAVP